MTTEACWWLGQARTGYSGRSEDNGRIRWRQYGLEMYQWSSVPCGRDIPYPQGVAAGRD